MSIHRAYRWHVITAHAAMILWQIYVALFAFRSGDQLANLLQGLGADVGGGVTLFLATHRWWLLVPLIFAILAFLAIRQLESRPEFSLVVLIAEVVAALGMSIYWREAWFGPMFSLIRQVG